MSATHAELEAFAVTGNTGPVGFPEDGEVVRRAVAAIQSGAEAEGGFRVLHSLYYGAVRGFFARRLTSPDDCLDLTQETFLRVHKGLKAYRGEAPFGAWLFRIAWNVLRRHRARSATGAGRMHREAAKNPIDESGTTLPRALTQEVAVSSLLRDERRRLLQQAIRELPDQRRRCIVLWAYHELTYQQIADVMRLSIGTVKAHLAQARQQLASILGATTSREESST